MTEQEKHKVGEWLKGQESELKINPSHYFDLIELINNYHINGLSQSEITISIQEYEALKRDSDNLNKVDFGN